jgi:putative endonuclease
MTNNLERRVDQHRTKLHEGFTARYNVNRLVYFEVFNDVLVAIGREKQIKGWTRAKKIGLIESVNRDWKDLTHQWHGRATGNTG